MPVRSLFDRLTARRSRPAAASRSKRRRSILESLEDRRVLASYIVVTGGDAGAGTCSSSACTLRDAILAANASAGADEISFASNVTGTITLAAAQGQLLITDPVAITGPGAATLTINAGATVPNERRIIEVGPDGGDVTIEGLTLTGGRVSSEPGGAIRFQSVGTLTIRDSVVTGNIADGGGAIYSEYDATINITGSNFNNNEAVYGSGGAIRTIEASVNVTNSTFDNNQSYGSGGAISIFSYGAIAITNSSLTNNRVNEAGYNGGAIDSGEGDVTITGSTISGNSTLGGDGGALYSIGGTVAITASSISGNVARYNGGGILNDLGSLTIADSSISGNQAQYGDGGGISNFGGNLTITRSSISNNASVTDGGGISNVSAAVVIRDTTINNNTAGGDGGGIATITGALTVTNSTISTNLGNVRGGGIQTDNAPVHLVNTTLTGNSSSISGGGIGTLNDGIFVGDNFATISLHNSIVAGNTSPTGPDFVSPADPVNSLEVQNSLVGNNKDTSLAQSNGTGGNFIGTPLALVNPGLGPLAANGGPTLTHDLASNSLAVDSGSNALALDFGADGQPGGGDDVALNSDQRGGLFARIANAGGGGATVDMGAVERQARPVLTVDTSVDESDGNLAPGDRSLRELIELANASDGFDTIIVPASIGSSISLLGSLGPLVISETVNIIGPGADKLTITNESGASQRLIDITSTAGNVTIGGLKLSGGDAGDQAGGAIRMQSDGDLILKQVEVSGNAAATGGGVFANDGTVSIGASLIAENTATGDGGGIAVAGAMGLLVIVDSTISGNSASGGGGVAVASGSVVIASSTITLNDATTQGGGVRMATGSNSLNIDNSIIAENTAAAAPDFNAPQNPGTNLAVDSSFIGSNAGTLLTASALLSGVPQKNTNGNFIGGGSGALLSPQLSPLSDNGGPTRTHSPLNGSLVIDNGSTVLLPLDQLDVNSNANTTEVLPIDVRSAMRVVGAVDMGSVELAPIPNVTWDMPADITYGTALGAAQLNAVSTAAGSFVYTPASGTVLDAGSAQTLSAVFTPNDPFSFRSVTITTTINVNAVDPVVTWNTPTPIVYGTLLSATQLNATADFPGTFVYTPPLDTQLDAGIGQQLSVRFTPDDTNLNEIIRTVMIDVAKADPVLTWTDPDDIIAGTALGSTQLDASADQPGTIVYLPTSGTVLAVGDNQTLTATFTPTDADNYNSVSAMVSINVRLDRADDYGDAPSSYPVLLADDGARHGIGALRLGTTISADADGQPSANADADNDDGVVLIADLVALSDVDTTASFLVTSSGAGFLDAWVDFGSDGSWDAEDQIANSLAVVAGTNVISFTVPSGSVADFTAARFRLSSTGGLDPTGQADDGEVEDYIVEILDGDFQADAIVTLPGTTSTVDIESGDVVVRSSGVIVFRAPADSLTELQIDGSDGDDTIQVGLGSLSDLGLLVLNGGPGTNTLLVDVAALDLTNIDAVVAENFAQVSLLASGENVLKLDADTVTALSPSDEVITVQADSAVDRFIFTDVADWRMAAPENDGGEFVLVAVNQATGQTVRARMSSGWQNILDPSDINNSGGVTANDALIIINELGRQAFSTAPSGVLDDPLSVVPFPGNYYDQNGDGSVTALDALRVINQLARLNGSGGGSEQIEGEQTSTQVLPLQTIDTDARPRSITARETTSIGVARPQSKPLNVSTSASNRPLQPQPTTSESPTESWAERVDQYLAEMGIETQIR